MYNKKQLIKDITEYCNENDVDPSDAFSVTEGLGDRDLSYYIPNLDIVLSNVSDHGVILLDSGDSYYAQYQCSTLIGNKYITIVINNSFEQYQIESIEDIADIIIDMEENFQNIIKLICEKD